MPRRKSSIAQLRSTLYTLAKLLGDVRAVQTGTVGRRAARRLTGKATGRMLGKFFR